MKSLLANSLSLLTWVGISAFYLTLSIYSGRSMDSVAGTITAISMVMGFACAWWVWSRLKPEGDYPLWIALFIALGAIGSKL